jgi:hypothetical protein
MCKPVLCGCGILKNKVTPEDRAAYYNASQEAMKSRLLLIAGALAGVVSFFETTSAINNFGALSWFPLCFLILSSLCLLLSALLIELGFRNTSKSLTSLMENFGDDKVPEYLNINSKGRLFGKIEICLFYTGTIFGVISIGLTWYSRYNLKWSH